MVLDYLRKLAMMYNTSVDKEVKLLDPNYDEGDIYKSIMNMNSIFIKTKTGTPNIIKELLVMGGDLIKTKNPDT
jgi:hypothetical protein